MPVERDILEIKIEILFSGSLYPLLVLLLPQLLLFPGFAVHCYTTLLSTQYSLLIRPPPETYISEGSYDLVYNLYFPPSHPSTLPSPIVQRERSAGKEREQWIDMLPIEQPTVHREILSNLGNPCASIG